jgi:hypothetical protein
LYVSPAPQATREGLRQALRLFARSDATDFKVAASAHALLRPDKTVAYFDDREDRDAAASMLGRELGDLPAQGVPFTTDAGGSGLVSLGEDPPPVPQVMWRASESWRLWVTNRLALALLTARRARALTVDPVAFALARIALDGVDPMTWSLGARAREAASAAE